MGFISATVTMQCYCMYRC